MDQRMYTIGEFAAINKITPRMLRHYHKIGILKPARIEENGYRAYSSEQITAAGLIKRYRDCEFSLQEIERLLQADEIAIRQMAKDKIQELQQRDLNGITNIEKLYKLSGKETPFPENHYEISFTERREQAYIYLKDAVPENKIEQAFDKLNIALHKMKNVPCGLYMLFTDFKKNAEYHVAVPIKKAANREGFQCAVLESGWYLTTIHYGDYYNIAASYNKLIMYMEEHNLKPQTPFIERYFLDCMHTANPAEYITELSIKIANSN